MTVYFYHGISRTNGRTRGNTTSRPLRKISRREIFTKGREIFTRGRETFLSGRYFFTSGREIFTGGLYVFGFGRETLAEGVGATAGAGVGAGIGATTWRCNCLIISGRCAGCYLRSPFRLKRACAHARSESLRANRRTQYNRSERRQRTAAVRTAYTALVVSHLTS